MFALPLANYDLVPDIERFRARVDDQVREQALASFLGVFEERHQKRLGLPPLNFEARIGHGDELLAALQTKGWALGALAEKPRQAIREMVLPLAREVHARLDSLEAPTFGDGQSPLGALQAPVLETLGAALLECGALEAMCAYVGRWMRLQAAVLQVNTARETRAHHGELDALGRPARPTSYFHVDSNHWPNLKALIYLSDVGPHQGPFRYVSGSHRLMQPYEAAVRKTNDKLGHSLTALCALPEPYAQHANFGDFIDPATPEALALLDNEAVVCDGRSDLVLFDNNGVHRGGFVREGSRYLLQCVFSSAKG